MFPDTNNNVEDDEEEDDDDDDEPMFKFSSIRPPDTVNNSKELSAEFSCLAVHEKFLVIGKYSGDILVTDHLGNPSSQHQIKAHSYPVNAISIDEHGDFIGSCCQEGLVKISGLFSKNDDQLVTFNRPIKAVCLDPNFSKTKIFITGDSRLILNEKGTFGRHKETILLEPNGGLIHTLRWKEMLIAFANDRGVGVFDLRARRLVGFQETDLPKEIPRGIYPSRISWNNSSTLAVACAKDMKIVSIITDPLINEHQGTAPKKHISTVSSFKLEFFACGITSVNHDLVVLGVDDFSIAEGSSEPSLTVLVAKTKIYEEKSHDAFSMNGYNKITPYQYHLDYLADERCFFILSPYDIVKGEHRDYDDHIDFLISKNQYEEAIKAFQSPSNDNQRPRRHTRQSVYREYVKALINRKETEKAVKLFDIIYNTAEEWEQQILAFIQRNELDIIMPYIPIVKPKLDPIIYEQVLNTYLMQKKYDKLKDLLVRWPSDIYNINCIDQMIRLQINDENTAQALLECSAIIAEKQGDVNKTLNIYLKMRNILVFQLIERKKLHAEILPHVETLMQIDRKMALDMLVNHIDKLPVRSVYDILKKSPRLLHAYLDAVFTKNPFASRDFQTLQVTLYADYEPEKLMGFLRKAGNYNLQEALAICDRKQLHRATVFLCGRAGNGRVALQIILDKLHDVEYAIEFCRETGDQTLWTTLIEQSKDKPAFISGLLNHAGSDINLQQLIETIQIDLHIPGLRDSLCKVMQDYNIQMSLSECCRKIIVHDCLALRKKTVTLLQSGYLVKDTDQCAKCHNPVYSSGVSENPPISVFFCLHIFHAKCIEINPNVCGVCSTSSLFAPSPTTSS